MATVTGFTAERMLNIENSTVVDGEVQGDNLILQTRDGTPIDAGNVRGPKGDTGAIGEPVHPGIISMYGGATAPAGYLLCDGRLVSRVTYAALFAEIGTIWGAGDGLNNFGIPNLQQTFPMGKGTAAYADAVGKSGGSKDAALVSHQHDMAHSHTTANHLHNFDHGHTASASVVDINHTHNIPEHYHGAQYAGEHGHGLGDGAIIFYVGSGSGTPQSGFAAQSGPWITTGGAGGQHTHYIIPQTPGPSGYMQQNNTHGHTVSVANTSGANTTYAGAQTLTHAGNTAPQGVAPTNANLPPYVVVNFIIKT